MMNADEARKKSEANDVRLKYILEQLGKQINDTAENGKREIFCYQDGTWEAKHVSRSPEPTALQIKIMEKVKAFGYDCIVRAHGDPYIPRGLQADDGSGPQYINHVIRIKW